MPACGSVQVGDGETARRLVLADVGLARLAFFHVGPDVKAGRLRPVLEELNPGDAEDIHAVFVGPGGRLPSRVRAFIDYFAARVRIS
jgi:DNA-binding transcriptional LysR family regulator